MGKLERQIDVLDNASGSIIISDYSGGLNNSSSNEVLKNNELIIQQNWGTDLYGALQKVAGSTKVNDDTLGAKPIRGLFRTQQSAGTKQLLAICNGAINYSTDDGDTFTAVTSGTGLTETDFWTGVNYNDLFFFTGQTDNLKLYTPGTFTMSTPTDVPTYPCKVIFKRADRRLVAIINSTEGSTLAFSKVDPTGAAADDWSATADAGTIAIDGRKSEALTGGYTFGPVDIIFKDYAAFKVWGYPNPQAVRMSGAPGCSAPYSCAQGNGLGFHLHADAVWMFDGNKFINISLSVKDTIDSINPTYIQNAFGVVRDGMYWLFYTPTGQTTNTKCLIYDILISNPYAGKNVWYERPGLSVNCPLFFNGSGDTSQLYAGTSADTGFIYELDSSSDGSDDSLNILAIAQTKYFNAKFPRLVKSYPKVHIRYFLNSGSIIVNWYTDRGNTSGSFELTTTQTGVALGTFVLGTDILSNNTEVLHTERLPETCVGKDISFKFTHNGTGATAPIIRDVEIEWEARYVP